MKQKLSLSTRLTRDDVAGILEAIVESLKEGLLKVRKSDKTLELQVPKVVDLEIEAEQHGDKAEFEIEISWRIKPGEVPEEPAAVKAAGKAAKDADKTSGKAEKAAKAADKAEKKAKPENKVDAPRPEKKTKAAPKAEKAVKDEAKAKSAKVEKIAKAAPEKAKSSKPAGAKSKAAPDPAAS